MKALILETSSEKGLIALAVDGAPVAARSLIGGPGLSKNLALEVKNLLTLHSFRPELISVGIGPGSYTGIRVGAALAKALGFAWQIPLFGFCSLRAFAPSEAHSVLIDARTGGFYTLKTPHGAAELLSPEAAEAAFKETPLLASPHPERIKKRLSLSGEWIETAPCPRLLSVLASSQFLNGDSALLALSYLASP